MARASAGVAIWPFSPDWRWLLRREDSPWYPTMRLFRQPRRREWRSVMTRVAAELVRLRHGDARGAGG